MLEAVASAWGVTAAVGVVEAAMAAAALEQVLSEACVAVEEAALARSMAHVAAEQATALMGVAWMVVAE